MKWDYVGQETALTADKPVAIQELAHSGQRCRANRDTARAEDQLPTSTEQRHCFKDEKPK